VKVRLKTSVVDISNLYSNPKKREYYVSLPRAYCTENTVIFKRNIKAATKRAHYQLSNSMGVEEQVCNTDIMLYLNGLQ